MRAAGKQYTIRCVTLLGEGHDWLTGARYGEAGFRVEEEAGDAFNRVSGCVTVIAHWTQNCLAKHDFCGLSISCTCKRRWLQRK